MSFEKPKFNKPEKKEKKMRAVTKEEGKKHKEEYFDFPAKEMEAGLAELKEKLKKLEKMKASLVDIKALEDLIKDNEEQLTMLKEMGKYEITEIEE
jgi:hypothetical protein